jgi:PPE-repeat protein
MMQENFNTGSLNIGNRNTGDSNTGNSNIGNYNSVDNNLGSRNTGSSNIGHFNTERFNIGNYNGGDNNLGSRNTGSSNKGTRNSGDANKGHGNSGTRNIGEENSGYGNIGNFNSGDFNCCDHNLGFFGSVTPKLKSFDEECDFTRQDYEQKFQPLFYSLETLLLTDKPIDIKPFLEIPNITQAKLDALHQHFLETRIAQQRLETTKIIKGYKGTDKNMQCLGLQYKLGEWQEAEGELIECENGLHFTTELIHTYKYYNSPGDRRFHCEVEFVQDKAPCIGPKTLYVARRIKLLQEITFLDTSHPTNNSGKKNIGRYNSGNFNNGSRNSGGWNIGSRNSGNNNKGRLNTGSYNLGNSNTGFSNTGNSNTGNANAGDSNTDDFNLGHYNTGYRNIGKGNTGDFNCCDYSTGFFASVTPKVTSFDQNCGLTIEEYRSRFAFTISILDKRLKEPEPINVFSFQEIPNITQEKLDVLHKQIQI